MTTEELSGLLDEKLQPIKGDLQSLRGDLRELRRATEEGFKKTEEYLKRHGKSIEDLQENLSITVGEYGDRIRQLEGAHLDLPPYQSSFA